MTYTFFQRMFFVSRIVKPEYRDVYLRTIEVLAEHFSNKHELTYN